MHNSWTWRRSLLAVAAATATLGAAARASDCTRTATGLVPLSELGTGRYLGQFEGGLYPGGLNSPPAAHLAAGVARAAAVVPRDAAGNPDPAGRYVLLSIGMSNTTQEFCSGGSGLPCTSWSFTGQADAHPDVNHSELAIVNGAAGGQTASTWDDPADANYDRIRDTRLAPLGLSERQVAAVWVKVANARPTVSLPDSNADAYQLLASLGDIARAVRVRYPNVQLMFVSSRIYAGYASTSLNPEPYAYESGFAAKWVVEAQIEQEAGGPIDPRAGDLSIGTAAPWIGWGPYLWADGLTPRGDGLTWLCEDFENDGTHPSQSGEQKVGALLLQFMLNSPFARSWFRAVLPGDLNCDGFVNNFDIDPFVLAISDAAAYAGEYPDCNVLNADMNRDGRVDNFDIDRFVQRLRN